MNHDDDGASCTSCVDPLPGPWLFRWQEFEWLVSMTVYRIFLIAKRVVGFRGFGTPVIGGDDQVSKREPF